MQGLVAELLLDVGQRLPGLNQHRGVGVPEGMGLPVPELGALERWRPHALPERVILDWPAMVV